MQVDLWTDEMTMFHTGLRRLHECSRAPRRVTAWRTAALSLTVILVGVGSGVAGPPTSPARGTAAAYRTAAVVSVARVISSGHVDTRLHHQSTAVRLDVKVGSTARTLRPSFPGLSFEYADLVRGELRPGGHLIRLLRNLGPGVLRIGGNSLDTTGYGQPTNAQLRGLAELARRSHWTVLYGIGLAHYERALAVREATRAHHFLGSSLSGLACGNEPNDYALHHLRRSTYGASQYVSQVTQCLRTVHHAVPSVPTVGPDTSLRGWLEQFLAAKPAGLGMITQHLYPYNACTMGRISTRKLLSRSTSRYEQEAVSSEAEMARAAGVPLRITEANSIGCGGTPGVSNSFAAALWTADFMAISAENGASGVNFHQVASDSLCRNYSAICRPRGQNFRAQPVYLGMLLVHQLGLGKIADVSAKGIIAHTVLHKDGSESILLLNETASRQEVDVSVPNGESSASYIAMRSSGLHNTRPWTVKGLRVTKGDFPTSPTPTRLPVVSHTVGVMVPASSGVVIKLGT